jgi:hypothetical protein
MLDRTYEAASSPRKECAMKQLQEEQDLATRAHDLALGLFTVRKMSLTFAFVSFASSVEQYTGPRNLDRGIRLN